MFTRAIYNILLVFALPFIWLRLFVKARRNPEYAMRRSERFGRVPSSVGRDVIWFHSVSAGESIAAVPIIRALAERLPHRRFLVTTTTPTGSAQIQKLLGGIVDHCYSPYDFPWVVSRFVRRVEPRALVLMETELWPNLIRAVKSAGGSVSLINARLSERSAVGYRRMSALTRAMLVEIDQIICQYDDTLKRFESLGADRSRLSVTGSIKFDVLVPDDLAMEVERLRGEWCLGRQTWIAGSTHAGEEEIVLEAHKELLRNFPELLLVLVPRHPERTNDIIDLCSQRNFAAQRLGMGPPTADTTRTQVLVADTMGRLLYLYGMADVAFIGGSFSEIGGHNPIEAAIHGVPMLMGPHRFNFEEVSRRFDEAGCLHMVTQDDLAEVILDLLVDVTRRGKESRMAREVVELNRGSSDIVLSRLEPILR